MTAQEHEVTVEEVIKQVNQLVENSQQPNPDATGLGGWVTRIAYREDEPKIGEHPGAIVLQGNTQKDGPGYVFVGASSPDDLEGKERRFVEASIDGGVKMYTKTGDNGPRIPLPRTQRELDKTLALARRSLPGRRTGPTS